MKKLIFLFTFLTGTLFAYSQTAVVRPRVDADLLNSQLSTFYVDTSSTAQTKSGHLILSDSLYITKLATSATKVLSPTSTGGTTVLESSDASEITFDTLSFDFGDVTNDLDVGDTLEFDNGAKIHNEETDTLFLIETVAKVKGQLYADSIYTTKAGAWADYVFSEDYQLPTFQQQMNYVRENNHLPALKPPEGKYFNPQRRMEGIVEELEKAYLYIEQLEKRILKLEDK